MKIQISVEGYRVLGVDAEALTEEELQETADDLASDIGMRLCDLAGECRYGTVTLKVGDLEARAS